jgi:hypothetical protein
VQVGLGKRKGEGDVKGADSKGSDEAVSAKKKRKKKKVRLTNKREDTENPFFLYFILYQYSCLTKHL